eukprot:324329-Ditylum_brightwellii.AAC.1
MGIKKVLDDHGVNYAKHTIMQSSDLKEKLEQCGLKRNKAFNFYARDLPATARETIDLCMDIVQFGMKSTLIQFRGQYYVYKGVAKGKELSDKDVALAIGAYESAFIVASYVFEETGECSTNCVFRGVYQDNGLVVFVGKRNKQEIQEWLRKYQSL